MKNKKFKDLEIPLGDDALEEVYKLWTPKISYGCNVANNKYHSDVSCPPGSGCDGCILKVCNYEVFVSYMKTKGKHIPLKKHFKSKENEMNTNISNVFDKTKEALLVEKHLGNQIGTSFIDGLILADKKDDVLKEAKRLEKEEKEGS